MDTLKRKNVDLLVEQFWKHGYLTVKRKFGTYLPEPAKIGEFDVDIIARLRKNYAIGITLTESDLNDHKLMDKLKFLATRQTKFSNKRVLLFVGVPYELYKNIKTLIDLFEPDIKKNIRLFNSQRRIVEKAHPLRRREKEVLFS